MFRRVAPQLALVVGVSVLPAAVTGQSAPPSGPNVVTYGTGEIILPPDRAVIRIAVTTDDSTAAAAAGANGVRFAAVTKALAALGFQRDSLVRVSYYVSPNYDQQNARHIRGYRARSVIRVTLRNLLQLGPTIDGALASGATDIPWIVFESDSADAARLRALDRALTRARADAIALAASAGAQLGDLVELSTGRDYASLYAFQTLEEDFDPGNFSAAATVPFASRDVVVQVSVVARWQLLLSGRR